MFYFIIPVCNKLINKLIKNWYLEVMWISYFVFPLLILCLSESDHLWL